MTKEQLQKQAKALVIELKDLHSQIDILQDDTQNEADGLVGIEEESNQQENFESMANQIERCKDSLSEAINHLEWIV